VDVLVYVAGVQQGGADAEARGDAAAAMMEVNVVGAIRLLEHAAEYMRAAGRGRLAAVGSIAGDRGRKRDPGWADFTTGSANSSHWRNAGCSGWRYGSLCWSARHHCHGFGNGNHRRNAGCPDGRFNSAWWRNSGRMPYSNDWRLKLWIQTDHF
jgi:NAD(P)-dependent dehydrogenase (short-subunit alcohol dehydrogenase family)